MPAYSGKFQYEDNQGPCQLQFDQETCIVTPQAGTPIAFDLGDVDRVAPAEWELELTLYTGRTLMLRQFGAAFGRMRDELMAAWRDRTVCCLLLEDLRETGRYNGAANGVPAEIRLYRTNLATLPMAAEPAQVRLADVASLNFDDTTYSIVLDSPAGKLMLSKLARKTDEVLGTLRESLDALRTHSADVLHREFPFLNPDQLQRVLTTMPEGRSAALSSLGSIHPKLPEEIVARAVDERLKPYFEALRGRSVAGGLMAGFKFVREDEAEEEDGEPAEGEPEKQPLFFWFFFPLAPDGRLVAWEATTGSGRATYFFRIPPGDVAAGVATLTRGLALVNFRREPVYLSDESLEQQAKYRRYAIGARKLSDLRALRAAFVGRALHTSVEAWTAQVEGIVARH
ncbi:MAG TPA: hypothetical protein VGF59_15715 [Bryobacteraceae bacterium]